MNLQLQIQLGLFPGSSPAGGAPPAPPGQTLYAPAHPLFLFLSGTSPSGVVPTVTAFDWSIQCRYQQLVFPLTGGVMGIKNKLKLFYATSPVIQFKFNPIVPDGINGLNFQFNLRQAYGQPALFTPPSTQNGKVVITDATNCIGFIQLLAQQLELMEGPGAYVFDFQRNDPGLEAVVAYGECEILGSCGFP